MKNLQCLNPYAREGVAKESKLVFLSPGRGPERAPEKQYTQEQVKLMRQVDKMQPKAAKAFLKDQPGKDTTDKATRFVESHETNPKRRTEKIKSWLESYENKETKEKPFDKHSRGKLSFYTDEYANKIDTYIVNKLAKL